MAQQDTIKNILTAVDEAISKIKEDITTPKSAGIVRSAKDGIIELESIAGLRMGEVVLIQEIGIEALVVQIGKDVNLAVALQPSEEIRTGLTALSTGKSLSIPVNDSIIGRVIDPLGKALDEKPEIKTGAPMPLESLAPGVMTRESVSEPLQTGILAIDALIPIGRGQRELIIGDRQTGKTTIALDTIINQKGQNIICIYVAIGQRDAKTAQVIRTLQEHGAMDYTVVVTASSSTTAILQFLAPYAGVAIGEYFMKQGKDVLVVYDDLSKHALAYREVSLLLRKPPGREAYPGDVFYIHSRLLERAAKLNPANGGGSITALPIIETQAGDVSAYIPTNVISITDGQIFLEPSLFYRGIRPAINVGISVSRVGSAAQTKIMKKVSGTAKLDLAQYYELAAFSQFSSDLDATSKKQLIRGERLVEAMKQKQNHPRSLAQEVVILWTALKGYLDGINVSEVGSTLEKLLTTCETMHSNMMERIEKEKTLTEDIEKNLANAVDKFFART